MLCPDGKTLQDCVRNVTDRFGFRIPLAHATGNRGAFRNVYGIFVLVDPDSQFHGDRPSYLWTRGHTPSCGILMNLSGRKMQPVPQ